MSLPRLTRLPKGGEKADFVCSHIGLPLSLFRAEALDSRAQRLEGEIILTRLVPLWVITLLLLAVATTLAVWIATGHYRRIETVPGEVLPTGSLSKVFADRPGRIIWLGVKEGQLVAKGQPIATVEIEQALVGGRSPNAERLASVASQASLVDRQIALENDRSTRERQRLGQLVGHLDVERSVMADQVAYQRQTVDSTRQVFEGLEGLLAKGFITKLNYEQRRQAWLSAAAQLQATIQQMTQLDERRAQVRSDLEMIPADHAGKLTDLQNSLNQLDQRRIDAEGAREFTITAPTDGRVTALQAVSGRYTDGKRPILSIVPDDSPMQVVLFAPSRAVGLAKVDDPVRIRFDAFPYQRYGSYGGRISAMSRTILAPEEVDAPIRSQEPVYQIRVRLDAQTIYAFGQSLPLQPGMTLSADIVLDRRSFLEWLLEPLQAVRKRT